MHINAFICPTDIYAVKLLHIAQKYSAGIIGFDHPTSDKHIRLEAPLPEYFTDFIVKLWDFNITACKESAVYIRKLCQQFVFVSIAVFVLGVKDSEKLYKSSAHISGRERVYVIVELVVTAENPCILGIKTEDNADNIAQSVILPVFFTFLHL